MLRNEARYYQSKHAHTCAIMLKILKKRKLAAKHLITLIFQRGNYARNAISLLRQSDITPTIQNL